MSALGDWLNTYLAALPDHIRGSLDDRRLIEAARMAMHHGWPPKRAASVVANRNYRGATHPTLLAITRLEEIATNPPREVAPTKATYCICGQPHQHLPPETVTEWAQKVRANK